MNTTHRSTHRRAFTLIETVVSLVIVSILMLGLSSSVMLSSFALPSPDEMGEADREVQQVIARMRDDLRRAYKVEYKTSGSDIKIKLFLNETGEIGEEDRAEWVYEKDSDELTYEFGSEPVVVLLTRVTSFNVSFVTDGSDIRVLHLVIVVGGTIQNTFECHFLLPDKPELT